MFILCYLPTNRTLEQSTHFKQVSIGCYLKYKIRARVVGADLNFGWKRKTNSKKALIFTEFWLIFNMLKPKP